MLPRKRNSHRHATLPHHDGEALRDDENFAYVAAWKYLGEGKEEELVKEELVFENVKLTQRSYK